eukprot:15437758-Alexandrium_andersonii.AAC.1
MQNRVRRSNLELRGPKSGLKVGPGAPEGCILHRFFVEIPNPPPKGVIEGVGSRKFRGVRSSNPQSAQSFAIGAREA